LLQFNKIQFQEAVAAMANEYCNSNNITLNNMTG